MNEIDDCSLTTVTNPPTNEEKRNHLDEKQQTSPYNRNSISLSFDLKLNTIDEKYLHQTRQIYCKQCPSLTTNYSIQEQKSMFQMLSIGRKHNYPLLLNLITCYLRDRLHYFIQHPTETNISPQHWCTNSQIIKVLLYKMTKEKSEIIKNMILSAMQTYFTRYCRPMTLPTPYIIHDSIKSFTHCLHQIGKLITNIRNNPRQTFPLQIELIIIPRHVIDIHNEYASDSDNEDDFENKTDLSESEWEDDSSVEGEEPIPQHSKWPYEIDKIELQLRNNEINYQHDTKTIAETEFSGLYSKYAASVIPTIDKEKRDDDRINISNLSKDIHAFPHKSRLCIIVDRRTPDDANDAKNNEDEKNNEIYLFEPNEFNKMPDDYVREWYIESSYKCIIPRKNGNITSKTSLDGWINVFSFHIEQEDEIKCYFYRCGQMVRFMANDIKNLFM
eukprot:183445_1